MKLNCALILERVLSTSECWTNPGFQATIGVCSCICGFLRSPPLPSPHPSTSFAMPAHWDRKGRREKGWTQTRSTNSSVPSLAMFCSVVENAQRFCSHMLPLHVHVHLSKALNSDFQTAPSEPHAQYFLFVSYKTEQMGPRDFGPAPNQSAMRPELALCPKVQFSAASCP